MDKYIIFLYHHHTFQVGYIKKGRNLKKDYGLSYSMIILHIQRLFPTSVDKYDLSTGPARNRSGEI